MGIEIKATIIINILPEYVAKKLNVEASPMGGWLMSMYNLLVKNYEIEIDLISPGPVEKTTLFKDKNFNYFVIPEKSTKQIWIDYFNNYNTDLIHINGTEMIHSYPILELDIDIPIIVTIQGLVSEIKKHIYGNISTTNLIKNTTIKDILRGTTLFSQKKMFEKQSLIEIKYFELADYIVGRTFWDKAFINTLGLEKKYRHCGENLRESFYSDNNWEISSAQKFTIFSSQGGVPYKGLHILLDAVNIVKNSYPDIQLRIAGYNPAKDDTAKDKLLRSTYGRYLINKINKLDLKDNIIFIGKKNEKEMQKEYLNSRIFVQSSFIENSPNSLGEAMLLGTPSIASNVGGTKDFISDGFSGFSYDSNDSMILANYIIKLIEDDELCIKFSQNSKMEASKKYNIQDNLTRLYNIYLEAIDSRG